MDLLRQLGPDPGGDVYLSGLVRVLLAYDSAGIGNYPHRLAADGSGAAGFAERLVALAADPDRHTAAAASQMARSRARERRGSGGRDRAPPSAFWRLIRDEDGPWSRAMLHGLLADLTMHVGDHDAAVEHALIALPVMQRIGASDDETAAAHPAGVLRDRRRAARGRGRGAGPDGSDRGGSSMAFGAAAFRLVVPGRAGSRLRRPRCGAGAVPRGARPRCRRFSCPESLAPGMEPWALFGDVDGADGARALRDGR